MTEEDIAFCMGELENPLPEVDQEEHPLRVLSQENMTVVSTFTGMNDVFLRYEIHAAFSQGRHKPGEPGNVRDLKVVKTPGNIPGQFDRLTEKTRK